MYCGMLALRSVYSLFPFILLVFHLLIVSLTNHGSNKERLDLEFRYNSIPAVGSNPRVFASRSDAYDLHRISERYSRTVRTTKSDGRMTHRGTRARGHPACVLRTGRCQPFTPLNASLSLSLARYTLDWPWIIDVMTSPAARGPMRGSTWRSGPADLTLILEPPAWRRSGWTKLY